AASLRSSRREPLRSAPSRLPQPPLEADPPRVPPADERTRSRSTPARPKPKPKSRVR
uniref:Uncharacterized protein n=1 Tax=Cucumis melo TaxID=3656 RepID=A0A9I9E403_CUCME